MTGDSPETHTQPGTESTELPIGARRSRTIIRPTMIRPIGALILGCFLPALGGHRCSVDANCTPGSGGGGVTAEPDQTAGKPVPGDPDPVGESLPEEWLVVAPGSGELIERVLRRPECRKFIGRSLANPTARRRHTKPTVDSLERVVAQARCVTTSLAVVAPLVRAHPPPCVS